MIHTVTWISESDLPCDPTANVILCTSTFTIPAQLTDVFSNTCPDEFAYTFTYDDEDLPTDYLDDVGPLSDKDIKEVLCEDCFTQWVRELLDETLALTIITSSSDPDTLTIPGSDPIVLVSGDGIIIELDQPNEVTISVDLSTDANNQLILGSDNNPYVAPSLYQLDGWYPISDTWTFASNTTINVPAGALLRYAKGDKIKIDNLITKYFYIIDVADTLLTVIAGTTYTVSNSTISNIFLSKDVSPVGFPSGFDWTSVISGFSVLPVQTKSYTLVGQKCFVTVGNSGAAGTSNSTTFTQTGPVTCVGANLGFVGNGTGYDAGAYVSNVLAEIVGGSDIITLGRDGGAFPWTNSGDKQATYQLSYNF